MDDTLLGLMFDWQTFEFAIPSPCPVIGADRDFDDEAAANWLKYAALMRPSTA